MVHPYLFDCRATDEPPAVVNLVDRAIMIALGTFSGALAALPRSGQWMVRVKKAFGFVMLVIAEYLLLQAGQRFI